jgi:hypothetical protein
MAGAPTGKFCAEADCIRLLCPQDIAIALPQLFGWHLPPSTKSILVMDPATNLKIAPAGGTPYAPPQKNATRVGIPRT